MSMSRIHKDTDDETLDFQAAMEDFKTMFPTLDPEIIESVLRQNQGGVDDTIDQLLIMTMDCPEPTPPSRPHSASIGETIPKTLDPVDPRMYLNLSPHPMGLQQINEPPPSYSAATAMSPSQASGLTAAYAASPLNGPIQHVPEPDCISPDLLIGGQFRNPAPAQQQPGTTMNGGGSASASDYFDPFAQRKADSEAFTRKQTPSPRHSAASPFYSSSTQPPPYSPRGADSPRKRYNPPLLGPLPDNFLRITDNFTLDEIYDNLERSKKSKIRKSSKPVHPRERYDPQLDHTYLGIFRTSSGLRDYQKRHKGLEHADTSSGLSSRRRKQYDETRKQAENLKDMMLENQWRRQLSQDPDLERYLEDERVAIMLQNREFMKELRRNRDFMSALERDSFFAGEEKVRRRKSSKSKTSEKRASLKHASTSTTPASVSRRESTGPINAPLELREKELTDPMAHLSFEESSDHPTEVPEPPTAFPFTKELPKGEDDHAFSERLRFMGKTSKQKFALMARKFHRKSKGAKGMLGGSDSHYSGMALLDSTDDVDLSNPSNGISSGYNQPDADIDYGIGQRTDLKEGRLFSK